MGTRCFFVVFNQMSENVEIQTVFGCSADMTIDNLSFQLLAEDSQQVFSA